MDVADDERHERSFLDPVASARHLRSPMTASAGEPFGTFRDGREERLLGLAGSAGAVRVRALAPESQEAIQDEMQLLAALEIAGIGAAPGVLEIEDEGYVREAAEPMRHREGPGGGHRAEATGEPPTGERRALARARDALDALIEELHERGWVLGATPGGGLGVRPDGSVVVLDLEGLRREEAPAARLADRRWVDSVLQDRDRTLRRRVHLTAEGIAPGDPAWGDALLPGEDARRAALGVLSTAPRSAAPPLDPGEPSPAPAGASGVLPAPRGRRRPRRAGRAGRARGTGGAVRAAGDARNSPRLVQLVPAGAPEQLRAVLQEPRLRRIAILSGALVLVCGALAAFWTAGAGEEPRPRPAAAPPATLPVDAPGPAPAPRIEDARALVAELAGARHSYLIGLSESPASGGTALEEDERVRAAYDDLTVSGGGPVVHSAEVLEQAGEDGDAVLRAVTSMEPVRLEDSGGEISTVPGSDPVSVRITLSWDGDEWLILAVAPEPVDAAQGDPAVEGGA